MRLIGNRDWWRSRCVSAADAVDRISPGATVYLGTACGAPRRLVEALEAAAVDHPGIRLVQLFGTDPLPATSLLHRRTFHVSPDSSGLLESGRLDYVPLPPPAIPRLMRQGRLRVDVAMVQVRPPDALGRCSLGVSVDVTLQAVRSADLVLAELNPAMPHTGPHSLVSIEELDVLVEVEPRVSEHEPPEAGPAAEQIARYVARLVDDGSTLQVGLGRVPSQVLRYLDTRRDLGIHSDLVTDAMVDLLETGAVTGRRKTMSRGKVVASTAVGTRRLYDLLDGNPDVVLRPLDSVSDPEVVAAQERMVSITQAYSVDLTGQVCAEARDGVPYGGVAAQALFHAGAVRSQGGRAIVCLASLDDRGESAVRAVLGPGEPVTVPRWDVHWVVTEWGSAYVYGSSLRERAVSLIEIAHPDHRTRLLQEAHRQGLVPADQRLRTAGAYPVDEERSVQLRDGSTVVVRPTRTTDAALLQDLFYRLRPEDVLTRFFRRLSSLTRQMAEHLCSVGYEDEMAFAAVVGDSETERVVGTSSYFRDPETGLADVAYMVDPEWQGRGLGRALHERTADYAGRHGVVGFTADVLSGNDAMLAIFRASDGELEAVEEQGIFEVVLRFDPADSLRP